MFPRGSFFIAFQLWASILPLILDFEHCWKCFVREVEVRPRRPFSWDRRRFSEGRSQISEAIPPHLSLIVHSIMTRKESKVIVMIALGSLFFWRPGREKDSFGLHFFLGVLWSFRIPPLRQRSDGQDWADKWARIERDSINQTVAEETGAGAKAPAPFFLINAATEAASKHTIRHRILVPVPSFAFGKYAYLFPKPHTH